jgi:hypothetical protein
VANQFRTELRRALSGRLEREDEVKLDGNSARAPLMFEVL